MELPQSQFTVQAQYSFKGSNNDELCFKKGDIITLTQREDGGWWEGTLGDKTGWFPSNYVNEYVGPLPLSETIRPPEEIQAFRSVVFRDLLESEKAHVAELRGLVENFLEPLEGSQILTADEYTQMMCNFIEIVEMHEEFFQNLEDSNDRVGKVFLTKAPTMKKIHQCYCSAHPRAIVIVDKYRDDLNAFMEKQGAAKPGLLVLTTGLSKPFRRLDKYSAILQELERHMESCHPDRGDTQRSIAVYKDIASSCSATRRQKELELQILTGPIRGWQGQELSSMGEIFHMGSVAVGPEHKDRYFVLFSQTLLILSVSQRMSAFKYEGKLPLTGITVNRLEDTDQIKNAFEITGSLIDRIVAVCQGPSEANKWVDLLNSKVNPTMEGQQQSAKDLKRIVSSSAVNIPQPPPHSKETLDARGYRTRISVCAYSQIDYRPTFPPNSYPSTAPYAALTSFFRYLFKTGALSRYVVQALLYPQITQDIDTSEVVLRRRHRTTVRMYRRDREREREEMEQEQSNDDDDSDDDGSSCTSSCSANSKTLERQNAVDLGDEDPYEMITFFTGGKNDSTSRESTIYESYIDHTRIGDENESFIFVSNKPASEERKSVKSHGSSFIGSTPIPYLKLNDCDYVGCDGGDENGGIGSVHTSTARLHLGELKQQCSEQSQVSSFEHRIGHGRMACEDLLKLDDSMKIKNSLQQKPIIEERHSMPTLFVGNRFASSSVTEIYIPSWKDRQEVQQQQQQQKAVESSSADRSSVHSSSLEIPAPETALPVPDHVTAELLYNFHSSSSGSVSLTSGKILTPPLEFSNNGPPISCLSREVTPFRKHSINSDKKLLLNQNHLRKGKTEDSIGPSSRRCVSYHYVNIGDQNRSYETSYSCSSKEDDDDDDEGTKPSSDSLAQNKLQRPKQTHSKCRFCSTSTSSHCHSPRSSDSGMAGSLTISSPDPPKLSGDFLLYDSENHDHQSAMAGSNSIEHDACAYLNSRLRHSRSSHNIGRFALHHTDSVLNFTDSGQYDHHSHPFHEDPLRNNTLQSVDSEELDPSKFVRSRSEERHSTSDDDDEIVPKEYCGRSRIVVNLNGYRNTFEQPEGRTKDQPEGTIYKTGLYAHWWKKEKLPIFIVSHNRQSAAKENNVTGAGGSDCGHFGVAIRGSGKKSSFSRVLKSGHNIKSDMTKSSSNTTILGLTSHKWSKSTLETLKWEVLSHPPYSPDVTPSDCHLFRSMAHGLADQYFQSFEELEKWIVSWIASRGLVFFEPGSENCQKDGRKLSLATDNTLNNTSMSPPTSGSSHPSRGSSITQHMSQHKRSQSFNHHLSYNQVQHHQQSHKQVLSNFANQASEQSPQPVPNLKGIKEKANWRITNLRPAAPLRPALLNTGGGIGGGGGGGGGIGIGSGITGSGSVHHSLSLSQTGTKAPPTYEEDALVLRVIEAYCAAYQSNARNTMHSVLQPWTPCLPIRGGKLKTSKYFSSSNPQLPFTCSSLSAYLTNPTGGIRNSHSQNTASTNSINTSHVWREVNPNSFNLYSASISSLNATPCRTRYSVGGYGSTEWRSHSEEKPSVGCAVPGNNLKPFSPAIARSGSNYDNIFMNNNANTPLLSRVSRQQTVWMNANQINRYRSTSREIVPSPKRESPPPPAPEGPPIQQPPLYDRRLNRSFETAQGFGRSNKLSQMRRSTPHLNGDEDDPLRDDMSRNSVSCCNKLLMFYWQSLEYDDMTPTLRQLFISVRQLQQDMAQVKTQISEERTLRNHLQQVLMGHLESYGPSNTTC
ncbi:uncharacterized protein LOC131429378 [Malaya genurostris]|uniref:uncharacterized protein LOC131429378 n=1 Tax=Malaya genurostris TaxID=325434 RepID=UPI0026F3BDF4|nr:uncharacterized protein LOC131429378 [Malaya genurostris]